MRERAWRGGGWATSSEDLDERDRGLDSLLDLAHLRGLARARHHCRAPPVCDHRPREEHVHLLLDALGRGMDHRVLRDHPEVPRFISVISSSMAVLLSGSRDPQVSVFSLRRLEVGVV